MTTTRTEKAVYLERLRDAALDWGDSRALAVEVLAEGDDVLLKLGESYETMWYSDYDEDDLWEFLDDKLDHARPAGDRALPAGLTRKELESKAEALTLETPFEPEFTRIQPREFFLELFDLVLMEADHCVLRWEVTSTKEQVLAELESLIEERVDEIRHRMPSDDELRWLERLNPAEVSALTMSPFLGDINLADWVAAARSGSLTANWRLRHLIEAYEQRPQKPELNVSLN